MKDKPAQGKRGQAAIPPLGAPCEYAVTLNSTLYPLGMAGRALAATTPAKHTSAMRDATRAMVNATGEGGSAANTEQNRAPQLQQQECAKQNKIFCRSHESSHHKVEWFAARLNPRHTNGSDRERRTFSPEPLWIVSRR